MDAPTRLSGDNPAVASACEAGLSPESGALGDTLRVLAQTIEQRKNAGDESYTHRLLNGDDDKLLKKLAEEVCEFSLAAKEQLLLNQLIAQKSTEAAEISPAAEQVKAVKAHTRYEAGDVVYHLLVVLARLDISLDDLAAELNSRMDQTDRAQRPQAPRFAPDEINRGK